MPRPRVGLLALLSVLVLACGTVGRGSGDDAAARQCRAKWADLHQTLGENGNPSDPGTRLAARYDAMDRTAGRLAKHATGQDCPARLATTEQQLDAFFDLALASNNHDMAHELGRAEADLRHAMATRDYDPLPPRLAAAFAVLRSSAPVAVSDLGPALDRLADAELTEASVKAARRELAAATATSAAYRQCRRALRVIGDYELDEE